MSSLDEAVAAANARKWSMWNLFQPSAGGWSCTLINWTIDRGQKRDGDMISGIFRHADAAEAVWLALESVEPGCRARNADPQNFSAARPLPVPPIPVVPKHDLAFMLGED